MFDTYYALVYLLITQVYFLYYSLVIQSWHNSTDQIKLVAVIGLYSETTLRVICRRHVYLANLPSDGSLQPRCHYAIALFTVPCHYFFIFYFPLYSLDKQPAINPKTPPLAGISSRGFHYPLIPPP